MALETEDLALIDLDGVKRQMQKHDEFLHGMKAAEKQVRAGDLNSNLSSGW